MALTKTRVEHTPPQSLPLTVRLDYDLVQCLTLKACDVLDLAALSAQTYVSDWFEVQQ